MANSYSYHFGKQASKPKAAESSTKVLVRIQPQPTGSAAADLRFKPVTYSNSKVLSTQMKQQNVSEHQSLFLLHFQSEIQCFKERMINSERHKEQAMI